jgi:PTS system nitrogen regulatory IIA component
MPVNLIFVLLVPERATELHLEILSELAQIFSDKSLRESLLGCQDVSQAYRFFSEWRIHAPSQRGTAVSR